MTELVRQNDGERGASLPRVAVIVVSYWPGGALERCLESIYLQRGVTISVVVVNNAPSDPTPREQVSRLSRIELLEPGTNLGFCKGVNLALSRIGAPFVLLLNPDAQIAPDFVERLVSLASKGDRIGSVGGRILRTDVDGAATGLVDSAGLTVLPGRRAVDIGHGDPDPGSDGEPFEVFGITGAAVLFRREALDAVAVDGQAMPDDFFMYLDDVDVSWRLRAAGYRSLTDPGAVAWHTRALAGHEDPGSSLLAHWAATARAEASRPDYSREYSWTNQLLMIVRNDQPDRFLRQLPFFVARRLPLDLFTIVQHPRLALRARIRFLRLLPSALRQRHEIQKRRRVSAAELARWVP